MAPNPEGHVNIHDLSPREMNILMSALMAMDLDQLPRPDYELMSKIYNNWKWPSRSACSEFSRVKGKIKKTQAKHKAAHSAKPGNEPNPTKKTDAKFEATESASKNCATENLAIEGYDEDSQTRNDFDIVEDVVDDIVNEVVRFVEYAPAAEGAP